PAVAVIARRCVARTVRPAARVSPTDAEALRAQLAGVELDGAVGVADGVRAEAAGVVAAGPGLGLDRVAATAAATFLFRRHVERMAVGNPIIVDDVCRRLAGRTYRITRASWRQGNDDGLG